MKFVLILIFINLAQPQEPGRLFHQKFDSYEQCIAAGKDIVGVNEKLKVAGFCISEADLMEHEIA